MAQVRRKDNAAVRRMLQENDQKKGLENFSPLTVKLPLLYAALGPCLYAATAAKPTPIGARVTVLRRSTSATLLLVACIHSFIWLGEFFFDLLIASRKN